MALAPAGYNYAKGAGIESFPAAVVFAVLYALLLVFFLFKSFTRPTFVFFVLAFFCLLRFIGFIIRALLAQVPADGENINLFIAYEVIYNTGFFGIIYSTYTLILDRVAFAKNLPRGPIYYLLKRRFLFRLALTAAVSIGITGSIQALLGTQPSTISTGNTLRKVAIYIFLVCAILVFLQAFILARVEFSEGGYSSVTRGPGGKYGVYLLIVVALLLVAREAFFAATINKQTIQESLWYPLAALTELLAVSLFTIPGLVPARSEIPQDSEWA
ncbi:hypothetical protein BKA82DRAFT_993072 [Pisolithus tinctorius]|uniref:THH1/TOM1/TOM3 domain-containing protein n=1 Tax=Pisolithus tinctorius Marx 270 TaxID=870435 RepID=A0A0C3KVF1_PISTI|nr:hypothetical protein BKA82DRAFT_993072 [Pisolithus tinctorius]KIO13517.1 hypothetical protein M404DRAFT_993072 [Pisolithus tinctorius Marx 270]